MKKRIFAALLSGIMVMGMSGSSMTALAEENNSEQVVLRWFTKVENDAEAGQWKELADDVTDLYPNIKVEFEYTDWNGYWTKLPVDLASGDAPDIVYMHAMRAKDYLGDSFLNLQPYIEADQDIDIDDFYGGILDAYRVNGDVYGLPYDFGPYIIYYNKDLFDKHGVEYPTSSMTWDEFLEKCRALTGDGDYGFATLPNIDNLYPQLLCEGAEITDADGNLNIDTEAAADAIQKISDLINVEKVAAPITDSGNTVWHLEAFQAGNIGMVIDGPWTVTRVKEYCDFNAGVCTMYKSEKQMTTINGSGFAITKDTKHPEEAYKALKYITGAAAQKKLAEWGRALPSRASVREPYYEANDYIDGLKTAVEDSCEEGFGIPYYPTKNFQEVYSIINQNLAGVMMDGVPASDVVGIIQSMGDAVIQSAQ
ncbi:ABC transporter substrate-binding protein [Murimonas intestini]|uniref:Carbohydrate ABC transporter substrate-binding protein (CUT1 family) n=1 Tax=Murimonas intestini TaxID=1337051 RepID=A0AB73T165_9FIRM|nr:sugar ABC transporter substrate-binding protein [Murimonas intestini]MCR1840361.1 sugar ABC transporter substrate-binding protein [Murimonas intestini]MCR1867528.1 sugar ABC transporter substrate-binding protein [Murimonas intestini]MCR1884715.1 sugar ABC transporter substrate-binding protein [Murimonas intestini]